MIYSAAGLLHRTRVKASLKNVEYFSRIYSFMHFLIFSQRRTYNASQVVSLLLAVGSGRGGENGRLLGHNKLRPSVGPMLNP